MAVFQAIAAAPASWATDPDITIPFQPNNFVVVNQDTTAANYVDVSFDGGLTVAVRLTPGGLVGLRFAQYGVVKVWLQLGAGTPSVQLIAEE